ncbi:MAG: PaaI family thioesterase [Proteobacteria bacterium]|nr:PaaI family thioesterase [Pseudomonadota bacterium]
MSAELLEHGRAVLAQQAFSLLLGTRLDALEPGRVEMSLPLRADLLQQHGFVHGGAICYLADNALTYAGGSLLGDSVTSEFKINYLRPANGGDRLLAVATALHGGKSQAVCRCDIYLVRGDERLLCAAAQGTIRKVG